MREGVTMAVMALEGARVARERTAVAEEPPLRVTDGGEKVHVVPGMVEVPQLSVTVLV
jgi:hypothetical protein